jgi:uridylate kinase
MKKDSKKEVIVISLGGSVLVPDKVDVGFLKRFNGLIRRYLGKYRFILIVGGGRTCRLYQKAASSVVKLKTEDLDWLGIHSTRLNAHLLRTILRDVAYKRVIKDPTEKVKFDKILIAAGWKPGFSTDYDAVILAKTFNSKTVINMTNIDYLHDKDPKIYKNAEIIKKTNWKGMRKIVGDKWIPGMNVPFDPIATKEAQKLRLRLILVGKNLNNFKRFLDAKGFKGSVVE